MRQRATAIGATPAVKVWFQRFAFVLLPAVAFALLLVGKADTIMVSRIRIAVADFVAPAFSFLSAPIDSGKELAEDLRSYLALRDENEALRRQTDTLMEWQRVARELKAQNDSLRELLKMVPDPRSSFVTAPVVMDTTSGFLRSVIVSAGARDGIVKGQAALTGAGLVGRTQEVGNRAARVLLVTDINSRVPVVNERTRDQAVLVGNNSDLPIIRYLSRDSDVKVGDHIVTSGTGGIFPPGLPVGEVIRIESGQIQVQPFADLLRLEYVRLVNYALPGILADDLGADLDKLSNPVSWRSRGAAQGAAQQGHRVGTVQ